MEMISVMMEGILKSCMTEAICIAAALVTVLGLVALSMIVEACDSAPEGLWGRTCRTNADQPSLLF